jgi:hypothetical protein
MEWLLHQSYRLAGRSSEANLLTYDISTALSIYDAYCGIADVAAATPTSVPGELIVNVRFVSEEVEASDLEQQQQQQEISMSLQQALPTINFRAKQVTGILVQQQVFHPQLRRQRALAHCSLRGGGLSGLRFRVRRLLSACVLRFGLST